MGIPSTMFTKPNYFRPRINSQKVAKGEAMDP
ncbi:hypothetical protein SAMN05518856_11093 [Paenibacillus sp. OK003]|nr:hypothetical protein SAMN05518856_11093 [Paenibacillus sp. OK003]